MWTTESTTNDCDLQLVATDSQQLYHCADGAILSTWYVNGWVGTSKSNQVVSQEKVQFGVTICNIHL